MGFQYPQTIPERFSREFRLKVGSAERETGNAAPRDSLQQVRTGTWPGSRGAEQRPAHCGLATEPVSRLGGPRARMDGGNCCCHKSFGSITWSSTEMMSGSSVMAGAGVTAWASGSATCPRTFSGVDPAGA